MALEDSSEKKCFTFIWKLENASYCWQKKSDCVSSPAFMVDEIEEVTFFLRLYPRAGDGYNVTHYLEIDSLSTRPECIKIDYEVAFLASDGTVLKSTKKMRKCFYRGQSFVPYPVLSREDVFVPGGSEFLWQDTLTSRCKIWKTDYEMSKNVQCFARTRIAVENRSFVWSIRNFSTLELHKNRTHLVTSLETGEQMMALELFTRGGQICDEAVLVVVTPNYDKIKMGKFQLFLVDASGNMGQSFEDEFWVHDDFHRKEFRFSLTKRELMENKRAYLINDVLSLRCDCAFSFGILVEEICRVNSDCSPFEYSEMDCSSACKKHTSHFSKSVNNNFMLMLNEGILSDVKLRTSSKIFNAHKCVLSTRSPVFKAMFESDMKEKIKDCVDIEDFGEDTVLRMLQYVYGAEVKDLEWGSASELYEVADKYQILSLKGICSSYIKADLCSSNACETLLLADMHQDGDLKSFVQDFILRKDKDIINSEQWEQLMELNLKLAAETMRLKFKD